jgi:heptosyltransferase-2
LPGLKEKYPEAVIDWLTAQNAREILLNNPEISRILVWEEKPVLGQYDLVIGLEDDKAVCDSVTQIKTKQLIGAFLKDGKQAYTPSAWFDMSIISKKGIERANKAKKANVITYQEHMADLLGIKVSPYVFSLTEPEIEYGKKVIQSLGQGLIGVNTGAGQRWPLKSWGIDQTIKLIKRLDRPVLILGGEEERERNQAIAAATGWPDAGVHSIRQFASIINQCQVVLTTDSLAMHLAIALRKPLVVLFGPTSAAEIELYGLGEKLVAPLDCTVCYRKACDLKPNCMDELSVDQVYSALTRLLKP